MTLRALVLVVLAALALAAPAGAATVEITFDTVYNEWRVLYQAAPGERNDVRLRNLDDYTVRVHDPAVPVAAGERCRAIDEHTARCGVPSDAPYQGFSNFLTVAVVRTGDGNDLARVEGAGLPRLLADGGPGDDTLIGSDTGADGLDGGGGHDRLSGRGNGDTLTDGDARNGAPPDADILDGGDDEASDIVDYANRRGDLVVDLADDVGDGERGEGDRLVSIEGVAAGFGDDDIGGGPGQNWLRGGEGKDHLDGEGGADTLDGGLGDDRLHGHAGGDSLDGGEGRDRLRGDDGNDTFADPTRGDRLACGAGFDDVTNGSAVFLPRDCESLRFVFGANGRPAVIDSSHLLVEPHPVLSSTGRSIRVTVGCTYAADSGGVCGDSSGTVRVSTSVGVRLGIGRLVGEFEDGPPGTPRAVTVTVRLSAPGRRLAARGGILRISLRGRNLPTASWRVRARR